MRIVFFGTSPLAATCLAALCNTPHEICAVISQPDRPAGRGRKLQAPAVAALAKERKLTLLQPDNIRSDDFFAELQAFAPDLIVVAAYGKLIPNNILELPQHRCINVHPSLLPKYRGAAPINWAILNGDEVTGVSIMYLAETMDAGDVLRQEEVPLSSTITASELHDQLAELGATLLVETIDAIAAGTAQASAQNEAAVTLAPKLSKEQGRIDWSQPARTIINQIRGLQPWPVAHTTIHDTALKIYCAEIPDDRSVPDDAQPGDIVEITRSIQVACGDGRLCLTNVQLAGKKRMSSSDLLRGYTISAGDKLQ